MSYLKIFAATIEVFFFGALVSGWSNIGILLRGQYFSSHWCGWQIILFVTICRCCWPVTGQLPVLQFVSVKLEQVKVKLFLMITLFSISWLKILRSPNYSCVFMSVLKMNATCIATYTLLMTHQLKWIWLIWNLDEGFFLLECKNTTQLYCKEQAYQIANIYSG